MKETSNREVIQALTLVNFRAGIAGIHGKYRLPAANGASQAYLARIDSRWLVESLSPTRDGGPKDRDCKLHYHLIIPVTFFSAA